MLLEIFMFLDILDILDILDFLGLFKSFWLTVPPKDVRNLVITIWYTLFGYYFGFNKEQFPNPQFLPCLWPKFASSLERFWRERAPRRTLEMIFFFAKIGGAANHPSSSGAARRATAAHQTCSTHFTHPSVATPTRLLSLAHTEQLRAESSAAANSRHATALKLPLCAKIKDGRDKVNS